MKIVKRKAQMTIGAVALATASILAAGVPASAATSATGWARCPVGKFCVFTEPNGQGAMATFTSGDANLAVAPGPSGLNANIESVWNRNGLGFVLYSKAGYDGDSRAIFDYQGKVNLGSKLANNVRSVKIVNWNP